MITLENAKERASDRAYRVLRDEILDGDLAAGAVLGEVELAERLGVSRTPVREALSRLVADGLVATSGARGLEVTAFDDEHLDELYELREALEVTAARLAASRRQTEIFESLRSRFENSARALSAGNSAAVADYYQLVSDFDDAIDEAVANTYLSHALHTVRVHSVRARRLARSNVDRLVASAGEHLLIVEAILEGDSTLAANATQVHLHMSLRNARSHVSHANAHQERSA